MNSNAESGNRDHDAESARKELADLRQKWAVASAKIELMTRTLEDLRLQNCRLEAQHTECRIGRAVAEERASAAREAASHADAMHRCCSVPQITAAYVGGAPCGCHPGCTPVLQATSPASSGKPDDGSSGASHGTSGSTSGSAGGSTSPSSEPTLQNAKITFSLPEGDDKDDNTAVTVTVSSKINNQFDTVIARLEAFGQQQVWEDDGSHSYSYDLPVMPGIKRSDVTSGGIKTTIEWMPVGDDRCFFAYTMVLGFSDGSQIGQSSPQVIEMSENIRTYTNP